MYYKFSVLDSGVERGYIIYVSSGIFPEQSKRQILKIGKTMAENIATPHVVKKSRPTGVWILTIYALIFVGIAPLVLSMYILVSGNATGNVLNILLSLPISIGVISSAIGTWNGNEKARKSLLLLVTLHYVLIAVNNYTFISSGQVPGNEQTRLWGRVLRGFIYPAVYIWYFNKYTTKEFYNSRVVTI